MEWEFTAAEVVRGEVDYGLAEFRADLLKEVEQNMGGMEGVAPERIFEVIYDLCYWCATGNEYDEFLSGLDQDSFLPAFLGTIRAHLEPNIEMLGAILQSLIMERVEGKNIPLEEALKQVDELNRQVVAKRVLN
ncbi:MAG: hypothetical protein KJ795_08280 [Gammaproteobacteria bacterium]|nr:hypothetical protein [Gammaproteobacteria bacterium]MBU1777771.1 hypothetical protein [Gammaproteobacteria bacterium]MBU1969987.1 hypothetical protein [Gammaproteobacteria bacterium]